MHVSAVRTWGAGLLALFLAVLVAPGQAAAHSDLESSDPADGAVLAEAPKSLSFTFNEELLDGGSAVTLTALGTGERLEVGPVEVDGPNVAVAWPDESPAGEFRAAFRVVSADGHPIDGAIEFTVEQAFGGGDPGASPEPASAEPSPEPAATDPSPEPASEEPSPVAVSQDAQEDQADPGVLMWVLGLGLVILVGAGAGTWVTRRSR